MRPSRASVADRGARDRYLLDSAAALDGLDETAVTGARKDPHDAAAVAAAAGTAGLYRLVQGRLPPGEVRLAHWLAKPDGWSYEGLYGALGEAVAGVPAELWVRHLVLGPTPELCLLAAAEAGLPAGVEPLAVPLEPVGSFSAA